MNIIIVFSINYIILDKLNYCSSTLTIVQLSGTNNLRNILFYYNIRCRYISNSWISRIKHSVISVTKKLDSELWKSEWIPLGSTVKALACLVIQKLTQIFFLHFEARYFYIIIWLIDKDSIVTSVCHYLGIGTDCYVYMAEVLLHTKDKFFTHLTTVPNNLLFLNF